MLLSRLATTSARTLVRPQAAPLARFLRHGSSQTVRSSAALIDPAVLSRDDSSKAGPALHAAENLDALLRGDTKKPNAQNEFTETAVADAPQLHGRYASIAAPPRAQTMPKPEFTEEQAADHAWRQTNHIWSNDELEKVSVEKHEPVTMSDHFMKGVMNVLYHGFNFVTGYDPVDPSPRSVAWRLIILESFAGVPGFVAAGFRHFYSLRTLKRDHGAIYTFLEEAENERMHLLVCLKMFEASPITRALCVAAQFGMTPFLALTYAVHPGSMHRFVGYLEETAVETYTNLVEKTTTPGTKLHDEWQGLSAPGIAKAYWKLDRDAKWVDCLQHMLADESHHRDVNHTFATLPEGAPNPFIKQHMQDFDKAATAHAVKKLNQ